MSSIWYDKGMAKRQQLDVFAALRDIFPPTLRRDPLYWRRLVLGLVIIILIITQLFTFEKFPSITSTWQFPGGVVVAAILAGLIPRLAVLSGPCVLSMPLSRSLWRVSQGSLVGVSTMWCGISLWCTLTQPLSESGLLGATLPLVNGWWTVSFSLLLLMAALVVVLQPHDYER